MRLVLDSMIVSAVCTPRAEEHKRIAAWCLALLQRGAVILVLPEIVDYEVRRGLLHEALRNERTTTKAIDRLDELGKRCLYVALQTSMMRKAAHLWAEARARGNPTAPDDTLDADPILAAQALHVQGVVVTQNVRHLAQFVEAKRWSDIIPGSL